MVYVSYRGHLSDFFCEEIERIWGTSPTNYHLMKAENRDAKSENYKKV